MGSTYTSLHVHLVWSTKHRQPFIHSAWRQQLFEYLGGTVRGLGGVALAVGGVEDHVHLLVRLHTTHRLADFVREVKKASSTWAAQNHQSNFGWQDGYGAFAVSGSHLGVVERYIRNQEEHHRKVSFAAELDRVLVRNGLGPSTP